METNNTKPDPSKHPGTGGWSLRQTLAFWFSLIAVFSCVCVGILTYYLCAEGIRGQLFEHLEFVRDDKISAISAWAEERKDDVEVWRRAAKLVSICKKHQAGDDDVSQAHVVELDNLRTTYNYDTVFIADPTTGVSFVTATPSSRRTDRLDRRYVAEIFESRRNIITDVFRGKLDHRPKIMVAGPIVGPKTTEILGILVFQVAMDTDFYPVFMQSEKLGKTGEALLINREQLVQSPLKFSSGSIAKSTIEAEPAKRAAAGQSGRIAIEDYRSVPVMAAYGYIDDADWGIVVKQDMSEIDAPVRQMARNVALLSLVVLMAAVTLGLVVARRIAQPAAKIAAVAQQIGAGNTETRAAQVGPAEIRRIAENLNLMVEALSRRVRVNRVLNNIYVAASGKNRVNDLFDEALPQIMEATRSQTGVVYLIDESEEEFDRVLSVGMPQEQLAGRFRLSPPDHLLADAAENGSVRLFSQIPEGNDLRIVTQAGESRPRALMAIPLMRSGQAIAVIGLASLYDYRPEDEELAETLCLSFGQSVTACLVGQRIEAQAEELRCGNEELAAANEELQSQSEELREQAEELEAQRTAVEEADRLKSQFLSNMSHELRTPLNSVLALSQLMISRGPGTKPEQDLEYLRIIERNGRHLLSLINDILDLSKIEAGRMEPFLAEFEAKDVVDRVIEITRPLAEEKGLDLTVRMDDAPTIRSDEDKVRQILLNLVSNAVKFTDEGHIEITVSSRDSQVSFAVRDTGLGIADTELDRIFDEFRQVDGSTTRAHDGTGLGLAIGRKLARLLGGDISVESTVSEGSTFTLTLPLRLDGFDGPVELGEPTAAIRPHVRKAGVSHTASSHVLVVEDNEVAALQIRTALEESGHRVTVAPGGAEALLCLEQTVPDAIVLDLMMPEVDGFEVLRRIRAIDSLAHVPVLVLTAKELTAEDRENLKSNHIQELLQKGSINRDELVAHVDRLFGDPSVASNETQQSRPKSVEATSAEEASANGKKMILIAEDHPDNRFTLTQLLDELGYRHIIAEDGWQAVAAAKEHLPDLILMDLQLPGLGGLDAAQQIKEDPATADIPIIAVTAKAMKGDRNAIIAGGCDGHLPKPIDRTELQNILQEKLK